ncbi:class I SAM-dependent methyltransferase [Tessaracoccus flavus]|uniref:class I SAM-dependent methyltransferase n=1 Tax=Tessaracoccus flavus TaxID=1610493 RepID=UPI000894FEAF|nr:class I SAM-dependent methyltransferase [Tessaracoccus flavus]SDY57061.1 hypothetical protein SAMN05428934_102305 [Tessaracoccus flavus]
MAGDGAVTNAGPGWATLGPEHGRALVAAMAEPDPSSLAAAQHLRASFGPELSAWALGQAALRKRAKAKFHRAESMLFTPTGLEQASRERVSRWRAERFRAAGVSAVWDLGCGIGADAMAFAEQRLRVSAVDADPATVAVASHNLRLVGAEPARLGRAEDAPVAPDAAVFLDPARRTARGRTWNVEDFTPPWPLVLDHLASDRFVSVKLGPGLPKELIPANVQACWVSDAGDVVEVSLWNRHPAGSCAVLLREGHPPLTLSRVKDPEAAEVGPLGRFLYEPDGAVIRAGLVADVADANGMWFLDPHVAYLSSDDPVDTAYATRFEVEAVVDYSLRAMRSYVREHGIGTLEIKKRALDVDPAALRRQLKPRGSASATVILARTTEGARAVFARRQ